MPTGDRGRYLARVKGSQAEWFAARVDAALEAYPDARTLRLRFERLARVQPLAPKLLADGNDEKRNALLALLSLGDAPVEETIRHPHLLAPMLETINLADPFFENPPPLPDLVRYKRHIWTKILLRDRLGLVPFEETAADLSRLADDVATLAFRDTGNEEPPVALFAMGKWGGRELNVSSDIDPVFFTGPEASGEQADRIVRAWAHRLAGGYADEIYPVDLRLRPEGAAGPLACSWQEAERYFFQRAAAWERIAYLRARRVLGSEPAWFREMLDAFLFPPGGDPRKRVADVARSLAAIHAKAAPRDVKRASGGIRDVEFLVVSYQLSEGREVSELRRGTVLELIDRLREFGLFTDEESGSLTTAYTFVRRVEHSLQAEEDRPRFVVPDPETAPHARLAHALGLDAATFETTWKHHRDAICRLTDRYLFSDEHPVLTQGALFDPQEETDANDTGTAMHGLLTPRTESVLRRLSGRWGAAASLFAPDLLAGQPAAEEALTRLESAVMSYGGPAHWARAFAGHPALLEDVTRIVLHGRRLVDEAVARPYLWERIGHREGDLELPDDADSRNLSDRLGDYLFHLGERFLAGELDTAGLTERWSAAVDKVLASFGGDMLNGESPGIALLALGKWGGCELAPDADLDLLLVCGDSGAENVAGAVQRGTEWLQAGTLGGRLLLDPRLRPEGSGAPLVITLTRLRDYLAGRAQPWEKIALGRVRFVTGDKNVGREARRIVQDFTTDPPSQNQRAQVDRARTRAARETRPRPGLLRIKKALGGMMDFEFAAAFGGWRLGIGPGEWWHRPVAERLTDLGERTGQAIWDRAAAAYLELRRWELVRLLSAGHRRGDVALRGEEAERFASAAGLKTEEIELRWREIAGIGRRVYAQGLEGMEE